MHTGIEFCVSFLFCNWRTRWPLAQLLQTFEGRLVGSEFTGSACGTGEFVYVVSFLCPIKRVNWSWDSWVLTNCRKASEICPVTGCVSPWKREKMGFELKRVQHVRSLVRCRKEMQIIRESCTLFSLKNNGTLALTDEHFPCVHFLHCTRETNLCVCPGQKQLCKEEGLWQFPWLGRRKWPQEFSSSTRVDIRRNIKPIRLAKQLLTKNLRPTIQVFEFFCGRNFVMQKVLSLIPLLYFFTPVWTNDTFHSAGNHGPNISFCDFTIWSVVDFQWIPPWQ